MVKIWNISFCGSIDTGMYSNGSVCTQKETEHNSGSSSIGIGGVLGNSVWLNCIYQDRNYSAVWISTILVMERYYSLPWLDIIKENLLNCILLLPAGVLLPIIANHKIKWYQALAVGILVSAIIEFSQLIFMRGLFEWDDMIHNGLGCMIGCLFANIFRKKKNRDWRTYVLIV